MIQAPSSDILPLDPQNEMADDVPRRWNLPLILLILFAVLLLGPVSWTVVAGDWNSWSDWKDSVWWPLFTTATTIPILAGMQYIGWRLFRVPLATVTALTVSVALYAIEAIGLQGLTHFPFNFAWYGTIIPGALLLDAVLVLSGGRIPLTAIVGGIAYGGLFYAANLPLIAPFLQPVVLHDKLLALANVQALEYHRSAVPEYMRVVEMAGQQTLGGLAGVFASLFTGALCMALYAVGALLGWFFAVRNMDRFMGARR